MDVDPEKVLSVDSRPLRKLGNSIGQSFDKTALTKLGLVDEEGDIDGEVSCTQVIYEDGRIVIEVPECSDDQPASDL